MNKPVSKLLTARDISRVLQISISFAYHLMRTGQIPTVRLGRAVRVRPQDLDKYLNSRVDNQGDNTNTVF
jgi:excisionase family DNA binding protein